MRTYAEQLQAIANRYIKAGEPWPTTSRELAAWAIRNRLWAPSYSAMIDQCANQLAKAMREEYIRDLSLPKTPSALILNDFHPFAATSAFSARIPGSVTSRGTECMRPTSSASLLEYFLPTAPR